MTPMEISFEEIIKRIQADFPNEFETVILRIRVEKLEAQIQEMSKPDEKKKEES